MSIRDIQTKNALDFIAEAFFVNGINPKLDDILRYMSFYFSQNPVGNPINLDVNAFDSLKSDPEAVNELMAKSIVNIETLYESCAQQIEDMMFFNSVLETQLQRLKLKRHVLDARIDDYLLGLFNADGYFYSFSESFNSIDNMDTQLSTAYVNTKAGVLSLSTVADSFTTTHQGKLSPPNITVIDSKDKKLTVNTKSKFGKAVDGLSNTAWFFTVSTPNKGPITITMDFSMQKAYGTTRISKIDLTPYGVHPMKVGINGEFYTGKNQVSTKLFSSSIKESADTMSFTCEHPNLSIKSIKLHITKIKPDSFTVENGKNVYTFIIGFKEIVMAEQIFDLTGSFVSKTISLPEEMSTNKGIDAVSLVAKSNVPAGCDIQYYVASDVTNPTSINDFDWRLIQPLSNDDDKQENTIARFYGLTDRILNISSDPQKESDVALIALDSSDKDDSKRNPTRSVTSGEDVYRVAFFDHKYIPESIKLNEGINTVRIRYCDRSDYGIAFDFWKSKLNTPNSYYTTYGTINSGHDFFYGGDVGESNKSVYIDTYVDVEEEFPLIFKDLVKSDLNSKAWDIRLFLNGSKIADLPAGKTSVTVPWKFLVGRNHVAMLVNIPDTEDGLPTPYIGSVRVMDETELSEFGSVNLGSYTYVDPLKFVNKQVDQDRVFTVYNKELVTFEKLTDNYQVRFRQNTDNGPGGIRLKIDLSRSSQYDRFTPTVDFYRLRFA